MKLTREQWLLHVKEKLETDFKRVGFPLPKLRVSVGWPLGTIGECFPPVWSKDGHHEWAEIGLPTCVCGADFVLKE